MSPGTRILRGDLSWVHAGAVQVGDVLVGFDEENGPAREGLRAPTRYRRWQQTAVVAVRRLVKPCYRLTFDDGTTVVASADHLWLGGSHRTGGRGWRWQKTAGLVCNRKTQRSWILKATPFADREESYDAGWLGGLYDGEGHFTAGPGWRLVLSQKPGKVLDRAVLILRERGFTTRISTDEKGVCRLEVDGGMREALRLLMTFRPGRLIENLGVRLPELSLYGRDKQAVGLVGKEFLGEQEVVAIQTTSRTFIAEGLASHNCYVANFWRSTAHDPEAVAAFADSPVNECDLHSRHRWLVLSDNAEEFRQKMRADPDYFDPKVAGWWCWGLCCWIGAGWCATPKSAEWNQTPGITAGAIGGVHQQIPSSKVRIAAHNKGSVGKGVHAKGDGLMEGKRPRIHGGAGADPPGVHSGMKAMGRPQLADAYDIGRGVNSHGALGTCGERRAWLIEWFSRLRDRLRLVRVCCGDWLRVCDSESVTTRLGTTGIFFDPPYGAGADRCEGLYATDSLTVAADVRRYCLERGGDPQMRIVLAGYEGEGHEELEQHGWTVQAWAAQGGYGNRSEKGKRNAGRERLWLSPFCHRDRSLFDGLDG